MYVDRSIGIGELPFSKKVGNVLSHDKMLIKRVNRTVVAYWYQSLRKWAGILSDGTSVLILIGKADTDGM